MSIRVAMQLLHLTYSLALPRPEKKEICTWRFGVFQGLRMVEIFPCIRPFYAEVEAQRSRAQLVSK